MAKFKDDDIRVIEDDLERLRERTTVYISYKGDKGALHLCKELINNAIDEAMSPKSPCKNIQIVFNEKENRLTVSDDGRGIPSNTLSMLYLNYSQVPTLVKLKKVLKFP